MSNPEPRLKRIAPEQYSLAQKECAADFYAVRKVSFKGGPWDAFIYSPELMTHAQRMGDYLRYRCSISGKLSELTILLVAREWTADYEFGTHHKHALTAGVSPDAIAAIRDGRRPEALAADEQTVWDFVTELLRSKRVSDATYAKAVAAFGEQGTIDLAGIVGYYSLLAMTMNVVRVPPPEGEARLARFPE
jgi:4-carboxymuconolactone decarboxylase